MNKQQYTPNLSLYPFISVGASIISDSQLADAFSIDDIRLALIFKYNITLGEKPSTLWLTAKLIDVSLTNGIPTAITVQISDTSKQPTVTAQFQIALQNGRAVSYISSSGSSPLILCDVDNTYFTGFLNDLQNRYSTQIIQFDDLTINPACLLLTYYGPSLKLRTTHPKQEAYDQNLSDSSIWQSQSIVQSTGLIINKYGYNQQAYINGNNQLVLNGGYSFGFGSVPNMRAYSDVITKYDARYQQIYGSSGYISDKIYTSATYTPDYDINKLQTGLVSINGIHNNVDIIGGISVSISPQNQTTSQQIITTIEIYTTK